MSQRKDLIRITYHTDDDTGIYDVGEIDTMGTREEIEEYIKQYGQKGVNDLLAALNHQTWFILHTWYKSPADEDVTTKHITL